MKKVLFALLLAFNVHAADSDCLDVYHFLHAMNVCPPEANGNCLKFDVDLTTIRSGRSFQCRWVASTNFGASGATRSELIAIQQEDGASNLLGPVEVGLNTSGFTHDIRDIATFVSIYDHFAFRYTSSGVSNQKWIYFTSFVIDGEVPGAGTASAGGTVPDNPTDLINNNAGGEIGPASPGMPAGGASQGAAETGSSGESGFLSCALNPQSDFRGWKGYFGWLILVAILFQVRSNILRSPLMLRSKKRR